jgi:hypothetical protein
LQCEAGRVHLHHYNTAAMMDITEKQSGDRFLALLWDAPSTLD